MEPLDPTKLMFESTSQCLQEYVKKTGNHVLLISFSGNGFSFVSSLNNKDILRFANDFRNFVFREHQEWPANT